MRRQSQFHHVLRNRKSQAGMSLIETMIALAILFIVAAGVLGLAAIALSTTENQGHLAARTAEYAQDKMEQLLALEYPNQLTDTTVFPSAFTGNGTGLQPGGNLSPNAPVAGYADYLDASGNAVAAGGNWEYIRVWQITENAAQNLKTVSVLSQVRAGVGQAGLPPQSTVVALKSKPF
jgi:Tfp pilus assembly protein PilV